MTAVRGWTQVLLFVGAVLVSSTSLAQMAGPTGWGWCPVCGRDMPASHFPHVTSDGGGTSGQSGPGILYRHRMAVERYNNGMAAFKQEDWARAEQWFREMLDYALPFDSNPHRMIGQCLEKRGLEAEALEAYQTALRRNPLDLAARRLHDALQNAIQARAENRAGETLADQGQWRDALRKFERAAWLDSKNAAVVDNLGKAKRHVRYEEGTAAVQRIVNGLVVEVQAPTPSPSVAFQVPAERAYERSDPSTPVPVGGRVEQVALAAAPARAPGAAPADKAPEPLVRHLESVVRLPNPLNAAQNARDRELLRPLEPQRLMALPPDCVAAYLRDRFEAAARQIPLASADRFEEEIRKLQASGAIPPDDDLLGAMRRDSRVAAEVNRVLQEVADSENRQLVQAARESVENILYYLTSRDQYVKDHSTQLFQAIQEMKADELRLVREQAQQELNSADREAEQMLRTRPGAIDLMPAVYAGIRERLAQKTAEVHIRYILYGADIVQRIKVKEGAKP
jgi:tetratricopeptide (TPR) repeat protein